MASCVVNSLTISNSACVDPCLQALAREMQVVNNASTCSSLVLRAQHLASRRVVKRRLGTCERGRRTTTYALMRHW